MVKNIKSAKDRIMLSLDADDFNDAEKIVKALCNDIGIFKVGIQLYIAEGNKIFQMIQDNGAKVYFDAKLLDIPNTVSKATEVLIRQGVNFFSLHIIGGSKMLKSCVKSANKLVKNQNLEKPTMIGVTILTSIGQKTLKTELGIPGSTQDHCIRMTKVAIDSGLDAVLAGGCETKYIRKACGEDFIIIATAIRPTWADLNDQMRVITPKQAIEAGADYLLIGRPITQAKDPSSAVKLIIDEIEEAIEGTI